MPKKYSQIQQELANADRKVKFVMYLFSEGPREYDFLLRILSLGRDKYWRGSMINKVSSTGKKQRVLDVACGTGLVTFELGLRRNEVIGIDVTREMLQRAVMLKKDPQRRQLDVDFVQARAENLPLKDETFDFATISLATRNVSSVSDTFEEMSRAVRPGGLVMSMDFTRPIGNVFSSFYNFYIFQILPALGLAISRHWSGIFSYLAGSIRRSKTPEQLSSIMKSIGLEQTEIKRMTLGVTALVSGEKSC